jgi:ribose transport system permease protein
VPRGLSAIKGSADKPMPAWINNYAREDVLFGLPMAFFVAIVVIVALVITQRKTLLGKYTAAIGGNQTAAELSGINTVTVVWILYIIVGFCAALAGVARGSYMSLGDPLSGDGMELTCIIAVLLGGTRFAGGEGSVEKTIVGAIIIMCVTVGMLTIIPAYWQTLTMGCVLIIAVALNHLLVGEEKA